METLNTEFILIELQKPQGVMSDTIRTLRAINSRQWDKPSFCSSAIRVTVPYLKYYKIGIF